MTLGKRGDTFNHIARAIVEKLCYELTSVNNMDIQGNLNWMCLREYLGC